MTAPENSAPEKKRDMTKIVLAVLCAILAVALVVTLNTKPAATDTTAAAQANKEVKTASADILADWSEDSQPKEVLVNFVSNSVDPDSEGYIPVENRIAVFDMDGTLLSETNPYYYEWMMFFYRVLNDEDYTAPEEIKTFVTDVAMPAVYDGKVTDEIDAQFSQYQADVYEGMTMDEYNDFVHEFMQQPVDGSSGMTYGETFYVPMKEVVEYLQGNDFTVYVVSGADRQTTRATVTEGLGIEPNNVIASDSSIVASNQGDEDGEFYTFTTDDEVQRGGDLIIKNLKMNKVSAINREIGIQPVLAFGNSSGDESMLLYTIQDNEYPAESFILMCDDTERDYGNEEKAASVKEMAEKDGFNAVSMKDDFTTIYKDGVKKTEKTGGTQAEATK